jgi:hypothetical protein
VRLALEQSERPMQASEIHQVACKLAGEPLLWNSVKATLSANAMGKRPRFQRLRRGVYQLARD